jgi:hypothetical protein
MPTSTFVKQSRDGTELNVELAHDLTKAMINVTDIYLQTIPLCPQNVYPSTSILSDIFRKP